MQEENKSEKQSTDDSVQINSELSASGNQEDLCSDEYDNYCPWDL